MFLCSFMRGYVFLLQNWQLTTSPFTVGTRRARTTVQTEAKTEAELDSMSEASEEASEDEPVSDKKQETEPKPAESKHVLEPIPVSEWKLEQTAESEQESESNEYSIPDQTSMSEHETVGDQGPEHGLQPMPDSELGAYEKSDPEQSIVSDAEPVTVTRYEPDLESDDNTSGESQKEASAKHTPTGCQHQQEEPTVRQTCDSDANNAGAISLRPPDFVSHYLPPPPSPSMPPLVPLDELPPELLRLPLMNEHNLATGQSGRSLNLQIDDLSKLTPNAKYDVREPITNAYEVRFINERVGWGLFATQDIPAGSVVLADKLISVWSREQKACKTPHDTHAMLERKSKAMGADWYRTFLLMARSRMTGKKRPSVRERRLGVLTANWEHYHLPISWEGKVGGIVGLSLAWANHACIPNCTLSLSTEYGTDKKGQVRWDKKPKLGRAIIRACSGIRAGEEITIPYMQTGGTAKMRKKNTMQRYGFWCHCRSCKIPDCDADKILSKYHRLVNGIYNPGNIADNPAVTFQAAAALTGQVQYVRTNDPRIVNLWVNCALIAGHHSDLARAHCFLKQARELALISEGPGSRLQRRISKWQECMTMMPGFGTTNRGLSTPMEAGPILKGDDEYDRRLLFMLDAEPNRYLRVSRYRLRPGANGTEQQWEIIDGPDPAPPKLNINAISPSAMCRNLGCYRAAMGMKQMERKRREDRENRRHRKRKAGSSCIDPEKDFVEVLFELFYEEFSPQMKSRKRFRRNKPNTYEMVSEIMDGLHKNFGIGCKGANCTYCQNGEVLPGPCECDDKHAEQNQEVQVQDNPEMVEGKKKKKGKKKGKQKAVAIPVVQDVGAERKVNVVEGVGCSHAGVAVKSFSS